MEKLPASTIEEKEYAVTLPTGETVHTTSEDALATHVELDEWADAKKKYETGKTLAELNLEKAIETDDEWRVQEAGEALGHSMQTTHMLEQAHTRAAQVSETMGKNQMQYEEAVEEMEAAGKPLSRSTESVPPVTVEAGREVRATSMLKKAARNVVGRLVRR